MSLKPHRALAQRASTENALPRAMIYHPLSSGTLSAQLFSLSLSHAVCAPTPMQPAKSSSRRSRSRAASQQWRASAAHSGPRRTTTHSRLCDE